VAVAGLPGSGGLGTDAEAALPASGVDHGVTGVLLAFRAWDTMLEVAVLLGGLAAVLVVRRSWGVGEDLLPAAAPDPLALWFARLLAPLIVLVGGYLLWAGGAAPGGAFQAGALLAGAVLICALAGAISRPPPELPMRALAGLGVLAFIAAVVVSAGWGPALLRWPAGIDYELIIAVEAAIAVAVAVTLAAVVLAVDPRPGDSERGKRR
jgi:multisubunit Na+/H+ antiporter MnhB subunit